MATLWFMIVAVMVAAYVVLDGFDLGAGVIYLGAARTPDERRTIMRAIGPVWDGNEVWLLAAGGTLYFAFPLLYASSFSGFYLPLMIVLWLLMLRGIGIELRAHMKNPVWLGFFDVVFCVSSVLLTIFFGAALGNVVRGVPLGPDEYFFEPLWTNFRVNQGSPARTRHPRLVHGSHRRDRAGHADRARVVVYRRENRRRLEPPCPARGAVGVAGATAADRRRTGRDRLRSAQRARQLQATCRRISDSRRLCSAALRS